MRRVLIVGVGALGTLFAERLAASGVDVWMLGRWQAALQALQQDGACVEWPDGRRTCAPVQVCDQPAHCPPTEAALVLVKSWQTARAAAQLQARLQPQGVALTLQNGLGNDATLAARLGDARVVRGVTTTGAAMVAPGRVRFGGQGQIWLESRPRVRPLAEALRQAGFAVRETADARALIWRKLAVNAAINPLTALLEVPNGRLLQLPGIPSLMDGLAREVWAVARAAGIPLEAAVIGLGREVAAATAQNRSSMLQDILRGAPTEIEAICGAVAQEAEIRGVETPLNRTLAALVMAKVAQRGTIHLP